MILKRRERVAIIGAGKMGEALISGFLESKALTPNQLCAADVAEKRCEHISETYKIECHPNTKKVVKNSDVIIIAVKPGDVRNVLEGVNAVLSHNKILISIAAGITTDSIAKYVAKDVPIVRIMPNIACFVREGMIAISSRSNVSKEQLRIVTELLSTVGKVVAVEEKYLDAITGLVGSGPAYIYLIIEALADAGVRLGIPKELAILLAAQTTLGASKMIIRTGEHPARLRDMVVTPAGTTIEGLLELEKGALRALLIEAITKAAKRAKELQTS